MTQTLPPRFREKAFRRYENIIAKAVGQYPETLTIEPTSFGLSAVTVAQRLRDAKTSLKNNHWETSLINLVRFDQVQDDLVVRETLDGKVKIGPRKDSLGDAIGMFAVNITKDYEASLNLPPPKKDPIDCTDPSFDLQTMLRLAHNRCLSTPLRIVVPDALVDDLYNLYDISLEHQENGSYVLT